jgi:circadian clock protein KaiC
MLGGGLEFGTTTLIAGQAGTGKSTLSTLFAVSAANAGTQAALFLFEERPEIYRVRSKSVGLDMEPSEAQADLIVHHFDPAEVSPGEFSQSVVDAVEGGVRVVVIDSLSGYLNALPNRDNVVTHLHSLLQYLARRGVVVIVTMAQHGLLGEPPRSDLDTSYIADSILLLRHYAAGAEIRRSVAVLKKRHSEHLRRIHGFVIRPGSVEIEALPDDVLRRTEGSDLVGSG